MRPHFRRRSAAVALGAGVFFVTSLTAQERAARALPTYATADLELFALPRATVKIYESTFDEIAEELLPLRRSGHYTYKVCAPYGLGCAKICEDDWQAEVQDLDFRIRPAGIRITGRLRGAWCNVSFDADLETSATLTYSAAQEAVIMSVGSTDIRPTVDVAGYEVRLPIHFNVGPSLTFPPIPITGAAFAFETARGPETLQLTPRSFSLIKRDGYLEAQAYVDLR